ncbi:hypothetical protein BAE44_0001734 [Dichanthelium oligosanthes]|uniref:Uncharacterized protein n=1 Tax=Dichanthelium oligosanthes TaxID=888268 RepID=A0A1E5WIL9_9POAL|nr:hypothetical protein BAE44_0001734 [Dichanthelium oligosanthes]
MAAAGAAPGNDDDGVPRVVSRSELVRRWGDLIDNDSEVGEALFHTALLRDARAQYKGNDEEARRRARDFVPWEPTPPGAPLPPLPTRVERTVVMGLRAPPHLARKTPLEPKKPQAPGNDGFVPRVMSRPVLVRFWEDLFDKDQEVAEELFYTVLLRDARAEYKDDEEEEQRRARVFQTWEPPVPGSALPPMAASPRVERAVVLGLRAPPHLARKHERTPSEPKKPRAV